MNHPKPRVDSWYAPLSEEERWEVYGKLCRLPWQGVAKWLREGLGIQVSRSALYRFAARMRPLESARRLEAAVAARDEARGLAKAAGARKDVADAFMAMGAELALRTGDAREAVSWVKMSAQLVQAAQKEREIELRAEAQRLDREKFEAAERRESAAKAAVKDEKLSDEERMAKLREIYGI